MLWSQKHFRVPSESCEGKGILNVNTRVRLLALISLVAGLPPRAGYPVAATHTQAQTRSATVTQLASASRTRNAR